MFFYRFQPSFSFTAVAPGRWVVRGNFHEGDEKFPEEHRNKQATPMSIVALAMSHIRNADEWTPADIDDVIITIISSYLIMRHFRLI